MIKNFVVVTIALAIDAVQILLPMGIVAAFAVASGTIAGGAAGGALGSLAGMTELGVLVGGFLGSFGNALTAPMGLALGAGIAAGVSFCISAVVGSSFIFLLVLTGYMSLNQIFTMRRMSLVVGKLVPFFGMLPFYTALTVACIVESEGARFGVVGGAISLATSGAQRIEEKRDVLEKISDAGRGDRNPAVALPADKAASQEEGGARRSTSAPLMRDIRPTKNTTPASRGMLEKGEAAQNLPA